MTANASIPSIQIHEIAAAQTQQEQALVLASLSFLARKKTQALLEEMSPAHFGKKTENSP